MSDDQRARLRELCQSDMDDAAFEAALSEIFGGDDDDDDDDEEFLDLLADLGIEVEGD